MSARQSHAMYLALAMVKRGVKPVTAAACTGIGLNSLYRKLRQLKGELK